MDSGVEVSRRVRNDEAKITRNERNELREADRKESEISFQNLRTKLFSRSSAKGQLGLNVCRRNGTHAEGKWLEPNDGYSLRTVAC